MTLLLPRARQLELTQPQVMGILNVTPDSFSDGGRHQHIDQAIDAAAAMLQQGASIIDIGGESTRPGAAAVTTEQELARVIPVITALRQRFDCVISIDTSKASVMAAAVAAGADLINDVRALQEENALATAAALQVPVCIMHMQGAPRTMQQAPQYQDVVAEVLAFLMQRAEQCQQAGIPASQIILDPGFGFGKTLAHNYQLLAALPRFVATGYPVLAGMSRKSMIGQLLDLPVAARLSGSLACATLAAFAGAQIIRVHDVKESVEAVRVAVATRNGV